MNRLSKGANHSINLGAIIVLVGLTISHHSPEVPFTIYDFAPVIVAIGQYVTSLIAHRAPSSSMISPAQLEVIIEMVQERSIAREDLFTFTNGRPFSELSRTEASTLIKWIKNQRRRR